MNQTERKIRISQAATEVAHHDLAHLAKALLLRLDNMTTEEFSRGGEREDRRALHAELVKLGIMEYDADGHKVQS